MANYRITNLATGRVTYLDDVTPETAAIALRAHGEREGEPHILQPSPAPVRFESAEEGTDGGDPQQMPLFSWDNNILRKLREGTVTEVLVPGPDVGVGMGLGAKAVESRAVKANRHIRAFEDWMDDLPEDVQGTVVDSILLGALAEITKRLENEDI